MKNKEYELLLTKELTTIRDDLDKRIQRMISDHNLIVDILNSRRAFAEQEGWSLFSVIGDVEIVDVS